MPVLPDSDLETATYGTQGWNAIYSANFEKLDAKLRHVLKDNNKILGSATQSDNAGSAADPAALTTTAASLATVSGTGDDTNINNNFTELAGKIDDIIADMGEIRGKLVDAIDYIDTLKTSVNNLLAELRKSTGNGVLGG